jgi:hypothetical protein
MSRESDNHALPFTETIPPLALAPLAGLAVLACGSLPQTGLANVLIVALYMAPFCYGAAALFVLPILAIWPPLRRPSYPVAAIWGILSAWCAAMLVMWGQFDEVIRWVPLLGFGAAGAASGLLYAYVVPQRPRENVKVMH